MLRTVKSFGESNASTAKISTDNASNCQKLRRVEKVVRLAKETRDAPRNIVMAVAGSVSVLHASGIRKTGNLKKLVQRQRKGKVAMPKTLEELILTNGDCVTSGGEDMLLYDSGPGRNRTVIFATISNLEFLALNTTWVVDGTFKVCPGIFSASGQLYTIQAAKHRTTFPAVYMLMTNRSEKDYKDALGVLKSRHPALNPTTVMMDFEKGAFNSFHSVFPSAHVGGCFFHFAQSLWRKLQSFPSLLARYTADRDFQLSIRQLAALAFVPPDDVNSTYLFLLEQDLFLTRNEDEELNSFLEYFAKTWVGYIDFTGRGTKPRFDIAWWNCYEAVLEDQPKTNNGIEGWHHAFAGSIGGPHPSIWNFIKFILSEQSLQEIRRNQNTQGTSNTRQRRLDSDLKALVFKLFYNE
ncbi:hypothetical protein DMENIID0001_000320 [Sergentomyia squamirostris]